MDFIYDIIAKVFAFGLIAVSVGVYFLSRLNMHHADLCSQDSGFMEGIGSNEAASIDVKQTTDSSQSVEA